MAERAAYRRVSACRACGAEGLIGTLDLGTQPHANAYHKGNRPQPRYPLQLEHCPRCWHGQLSVTVDPERMFREYLYVSGTTATYRAHLSALAESALQRLQLAGRRPRVLDIACNDGSLLQCFRRRGCEVVGVDPALNLRELTRRKRIPVITEMWGPETARQVFDQGGPVDLVTAANVLAHVDDPCAFLVACREVLRPGGRVIVEFPYGKETIARGEFDQVYHEHLSYFLARSFQRLATRAGYQVEGALETPIHGGAIRFVLVDAEGQRPQHAPVLEALVADEQARGLYDPETYCAFARGVEERGEQLRRLLERARGAGRRVIGYGASAKGNTMLNTWGLSLEYVVDDNPLKWGHLTPGRDVPIVSPEVLELEGEPLLIVLLAWNFAAEIERRVVARRGVRAGDGFATYVPDVREVPLSTGLALGKTS